MYKTLLWPRGKQPVSIITISSSSSSEALVYSPVPSQADPHLPPPTYISHVLSSSILSGLFFLHVDRHHPPLNFPCSPVYHHTIQYAVFDMGRLGAVRYSLLCPNPPVLIFGRCATCRDAGSVRVLSNAGIESPGREEHVTSTCLQSEQRCYARFQSVTFPHALSSHQLTLP